MNRCRLLVPLIFPRTDFTEELQWLLVQTDHRPFACIRTFIHVDDVFHASDKIGILIFGNAPIAPQVRAQCVFLHSPNGFLTSSETELNSRVFCEKLDGLSGISFRRTATGRGTDDFACGIVRIHIAIQDQRALKPALTVKLDDIADHFQ